MEAVSEGPGFGVGGLVEAWVKRFDSMTTDEFHAGVHGYSWSLDAREDGNNLGEHPEEA